MTDWTGKHISRGRLQLTDRSYIISSGRTLTMSVVEDVRHPIVIRLFRGPYLTGTLSLSTKEWSDVKKGLSNSTHFVQYDRMISNHERKTLQNKGTVSADDPKIELEARILGNDMVKVSDSTEREIALTFEEYNLLMSYLLHLKRS